MKIDNYIKYLIYLGILAVPFIPIVVIDSFFFPFITGKAFVFRIIVELIVALWLALCLFNKRYIPKFSWVTVAVSIFTLVILVADLSGANVFKSIWSNFERMEGWITIVHLFGYYLVLSSMLSTDGLWNGFFNTSIFSSFILVIIGFTQLAGKAEIHQGSVRLDATLGNSAYFAVYLLIHFFLTALMLWRYRRSVALRFVYAVVMVLQLIVFYYTGTRGTILGLIGALGVIALLSLALGVRSKSVAARNWSIGLLVAIVAVVGLFFAVKDTKFVKTSPVLSRLASINYADASPRLTIWKMAYKGFLENPVLGWGQENFNYVFNKYYDPALYAQEQWFDRAHNVFLDWLIAGGILGLASYLALFAVVLWYMWRRVTTLSLPERVILTGLLVGYFIHNIFVFDNLASYIFFFSILAFVSTQVESKEIESIKDFELSSEVRNYVVMPVLVALTVAGIYYINARPISSNLELIRAMGNYTNSSGARDYEVNLGHFKSALAYHTIGEQEVIEQLVSAASQIASSDAAQPVKLDYYNAAKSSMEDYMKRHPNDARLNHFLGSFLSRLGNFPEALAYLNKARELSPNKQTIIFDIGITYARAQQLDKALEIFKQAYQIEPRSNEAAIFYGSALIYNKMPKEADEILARFASTSSAYDDRIISAYAFTGNLQKIAEIYTKAIINDPKNVQLYYPLAAVYLQSNQRQNALKVLGAAMNNVPEAKNQIQAYINEVNAKKP